MRMKTAGRANPAKMNLWIDLGMLVAILLALTPRLTGEAVHEWLSIGLAAAVVVHLLRHWQWVAAVIKRFFGHLAGQARLNLLLNAALFVNLVMVTASGLMISHDVLPALGITTQHDGAWSGLHRLSADLIVFIAGLHVALHWKWLINALRRYIIQPLLKGLRPRRAVNVTIVRREAR